MTDSIDMVLEFHQTFNLIENNKPTVLTKEQWELRMRLLDEEVEELREAFEKGDLVATLDGLSDIQYILDGTYVATGLWSLKDMALEEVHASNMSKLGEDGKPLVNETGKVIKGPKYFRPDLKAVLANVV